MATVLISDKVLERTVAEHASALNEAAKGYAAGLARFNPAFRNFLLLTHLPNTVSASALDIFYSRYFWFHVLANHLKAVGTHDVGLDQQALQLLESAPNGVEWSHIEQLERQAGSLVASCTKA